MPAWTCCTTPPLGVASRPRPGGYSLEATVNHRRPWDGRPRHHDGPRRSVGRTPEDNGMARTQRPVRAGAAILAVAMLCAGAACTGVAAPRSGQVTATSAAPAPIAAVTAAPAFGDHHLSSVQPVTISVAHGRISTLTLTGPHGRPVAGTVAPDRTSW